MIFFFDLVLHEITYMTHLMPLAGSMFGLTSPKEHTPSIIPTYFFVNCCLFEYLHDHLVPTFFQNVFACSSPINL